MKQRFQRKGKREKLIAKNAKNAEFAKAGNPRINSLLFFLGAVGGLRGPGVSISSETQFYNATGAPLVSDR